MRPPYSHDGIKFNVFNNSYWAVALGDSFDSIAPENHK